MATNITDLAIGILVWDDQDNLLLLENESYPWGFAPPTTIAKAGSKPEKVADNLLQQLGIKVHNLDKIHDDTEDSAEHRRNGTYYQWIIYEASFGNQHKGVTEEEPKAAWVNSRRLQWLADRTKAYQEDQISDQNWEESPGLEQAWHDWLTYLDYVKSSIIDEDDYESSPT